MSFSSIMKSAVVATLVGASVASYSKPASAEPVAAFVAAGVVGGVLGAGLASNHRDDDRRLESASTRFYGVPGYQRAAVGPGRHTVCAWQERYDRYEQYIGSRRICWVEAR